VGFKMNGRLQIDTTEEELSVDDRPAADAVDEARGGPSPTPTDQAAFLAWVGRLVHEHRAHLARIARREGLGPEDAFDAVQEAFHTFIRLPRARALVGEPDPSRKLLTALTRNVARNRRRLHATARPHARDAETLDALASETASVEDLIVAAEEHVRLAACMATLAELPKTVVTLRMLDDVPGADAARILGITPGHIAVLLHRAKANLLACMTSCHGAALDGD
jgi:RNA polymerase sigma-70 factor (ECF subfamily)